MAFIGIESQDELGGQAFERDETTAETARRLSNATSNMAAFPKASKDSGALEPAI